jgi:16S rRNA (guanine966-N2)-methyltransferase
MRIIAGEFRGRKILPPVGDMTRPITDRAKQSVFDVLAPHLEGAIVYDLFAGTGSLGLECLSRGSAHVTFIEADRSALGLLEKNIAALGVRDRARVVRGDVFRELGGTHGGTVGVSGQRAKLVFLDPPYRFLIERPVDLRGLIRKVVAEDLDSAGLVIFRHEKSDSLEFEGLSPMDVRDYGSMRVEFLRRRPLV